MLKFSKANAKIHALSQVETLKPFLANKRKVYSLDILSGWSCPFAKDCFSKVKVDDLGKRKVVDGPDTVFRCFSASQEGLFTNVYNSRKGNFDLLRACNGNVGEMAWLIHSSLPKDTGIVRIHVAGDFFSPAYFEAWAIVANENPSILFYAYTKSLPYWVKLEQEWGIPDNFVLTASRGGRRDDLIESHGLRCVEVVLSEAAAGSLPIDHDDSHAARPDMRDNNFALLIHGTQPAGSEAAKAVRALKGVGSYSRKKSEPLGSLAELGLEETWPDGDN